MARPRLKPKPLWQISVTTSLEAEDAVVELLARVFKRATGVYTNEETKVTVASVYCPNRADWNPSNRTALRDGLAAIKSGGLNIGAGKIEVRRVPRENWAESWKRHFKPLAIGSRLLIKPSWIKRRPNKNQAVVILDPGLSFGTGNHPTTSFCLAELAKRHVAGKTQSFWDVGAGSGILAIAASKLGYHPVRAIDFDPEAVRVARENARINGVPPRVSIARADLRKIPMRTQQKYDFICANLISDLLLAEKKRILNRLHADGTLVLAGILKIEFASVQKAYEAAGLKLVASRIDGEWRSGAFRFAA
jgi:ribosomal protein L11 methyltransferase